MLIAAVLALGSGIGLLIFAGILLLLQLGDLRALRTIRRTAVTPVGSWVAGRGRVAAQGRIEDGPAGPQVGPVSGQECPWYHVRLVRRPARGWTTDLEEDVLIDVASPGPPMIGDPTGRVALDPRLFEDGPEVAQTTTLVHRASAPVALPAIVPAELVRDLRRGESLRLTEVRLPYARQVYALALPVGRPLMLAPNPLGVTVFTTETRDQAIARRLEDLAVGRSMTRWSSLTGLILAAAATAVVMVAL